MVRRMTAVLVVAAMVAICGCGSYEGVRPSVWMGSGTDTDSPDNPYKVRFGAEIDEELEFGGQFDYQGQDGPQSTGVYALVFLPIDPNIVGRTYLGGQATFSFDEDGGYAGPIAGTVYPITDRISAFVEGGWREFSGQMEGQMTNWNDQWTATFGVRGRY